eukprot:TRINITY_DN7889_c6_g1_i1.p1 TRINITY_DN7889_c6_g1~~TRINITY_DN7889_c6_g1_i1.p1  ORF type:complete len:777 (+),score=119.30 TRINITY_DN7889_c6_g1_i1:151-2481(+)
MANLLRVFLTVALGASWQPVVADVPGGTSCSSQQKSSGCSTDECAVSKTNTTKTGCDCDNTRGSTGASFCLKGEYVNVWYPSTVNLDGCAANPSSFTTKVPGPYGHGEGNRGECVKNHYGLEWRKRTCKGVPDYSSYVTKVYNASNCSDVTSYLKNESTSQSSPCMCWRNSVRLPTSACSSCSSTDAFCDTQQECTLGKDDGKSICSYSGNSCSCTSGNYELSGICMGGQQVKLVFKSSSYKSCTASPPTGYYMKSIFNSRRRGNANKCQTGGHGKTGATHNVEYACAGLPDGSMPQRRFYNDSSCATELVKERMNHTADDNDGHCKCMKKGRIKSECRSCSTSDCQEEKSCTLSRERSCSWNAAASTGSKCSCASKIYKSEACHNGTYSDIWYKDVDISKCTAGSKTGIYFAKPKSTSQTKCEEGQRGHANGVQSNSRIEINCKGVADGQVPKTTFYSDKACATELPNLAANVTWTTKCSCEKWLGCKANTKFEKYWCAANGQIIKQEFSDSSCAKATGVNTTVDSWTDAKASTCFEWPPRILDPAAEARVMWECKNASFPPTITYWGSGNDQCNKSVAPDFNGYMGSNPKGECVCANQYKFEAAAMESNEKIEGSLSLTVSDTAAALSNPKFKTAVQDSIAEAAGVSSENIIGLELKAARRLQAGSPRQLASGSITASYTIVVPKAQSTVVTQAITAAPVATLQSKIQSKASSAGLTMTTTVASKAAPVKKKATPITPSNGLAGGDASAACGWASNAGSILCVLFTMLFASIVQ